MELKVFGSSSKGNGYALVDSQGNTLILECGVRINEIQKEIGFDVSNIKGALISHEHLDHSKHILQYLRYGIDIYSSKDVYDRHGIIKHHRAHIITPHTLNKVEPFEFYAFKVEHDVLTYGFMIRHPEMGTALFATDTYYLPYSFKEVDHWIIEANYDKEIMDQKALAGEENVALRNRIVQSHMSIDNLIKMLKANELTHAKNIILTHLSDRNSHEVNFRDSVQKAFGVPVYMADVGKTYNMSKIPF